jgi:predicted Rossmann fold nucleotide-binding protein DprA/Smf involved in DNA uptake
LVVPGPVDTEACRGSNRLLVDGALAVVDPDDAVAAALGRVDWPPPGGPPEARPLPEGDAGRILRRIQSGPCGPDDLVRELGFPPPRVAELLLDLEIEGWVTREGRRIASGPLPVRRSRA